MRGDSMIVVMAAGPTSYGISGVGDLGVMIIMDDVPMGLMTGVEGRVVSPIGPTSNAITGVEGRVVRTSNAMTGVDGRVVNIF
jgi:hypothetical protein